MMRGKWLAGIFGGSVAFVLAVASAPLGGCAHCNVLCGSFIDVDVHGVDPAASVTVVLDGRTSTASLSAGSSGTDCVMSDSSNDCSYANGDLSMGFSLTRDDQRTEHHLEVMVSQGPSGGAFDGLVAMTRSEGCGNVCYQATLELSLGAAA